MIIYLDEEHRYSQELAEKVANRIKSTQLKDIIVEASIDLLNRSIIFVLDKSALEAVGKEPIEVKRIFSRRYSTELKEDPDRGLLLIIRPSIKLKEETVDEYVIYEKLRKAKDRFLERHIAGVPNIIRVTLEKEFNEETGKEEWVIYTAGSNLKEVLTFEGIDSSRTITNDIFEIYEVLGIEAARNAIINEIKSVMEEQGLDVDNRHIMLVADLMTRDGKIRQMGRYGVVAVKDSVLARAAFEITVPVLVGAAVRGEEDNLRGPTENIIVGSRVPIGTGSVDVYMEVPKIGGNKED
jgi:DNA-directed RNA polymerase beta' subunit